MQQDPESVKSAKNSLDSERDDSDGKRIDRLERALAAARRAEAMNRSLVEVIPGGVVHVSSAGAILHANQEARRLLGYSYDELTNRYTVDWSPETIREDETPFPIEEYPVTLALATGETQPPATIGVRRPDGELFWAVFRATPVRDSADGQVTGAMVTFLDVTTQKESIQKLRRQERDLSNLIHNIPHYLVRYLPDGEIIFVNRVADGIEIDQVIGSSIYDYHPPDEHAEVRARVARVIESGEPEEYENQIELPDGRLHFHNVVWRTEENGEYRLASIATDISSLRKLNEHLEFQATHDALTSLANRYQFEREAALAIETARSGERTHGLLYLDLDQFKIVNDTCGHAAGDQLLKQLSGELERGLPENGIIARLGGDEFGVIIYDTTAEDAVQQAQVLRTLIDQFRFHYEGHAFRIGISIGVAMIDQNNLTFDQILKDADFACFAAKDAGRNQVHLFRPDDDSMSYRRGEMLSVSELSEALDSENAFQLYFQKIVPLGRPEIGLSFEILLRLTGPDGQTRNTGGLIAAAERYDLMGRIDRWVVRNALGWLETRPGLAERIDFLTINLSGKSLGDERFQSFCRRLFEELALPFHKLRFEITETAAVANPTQTLDFINDLRKLGIRFALDDFGSGLASFGYLRNLPIDLLKIDGSFVRRIHRDRIDHSMVQSIHSLASSMNIKTVAEFVENGEILKLLGDIGIDYAQGYWLHEPEPLSALT
ncbi:MAG: EAL domain-containing protein [Leptospirales bacterium]|jgi:diguanylate cyclase (GGDEF)-like protein/PAS domain S-box-containing protein